MLVKSNMSEAAFNAEWGGWRYPFWISILLVGVSVYIRLKMNESPIFAKLKHEKKTSVNPLKESFGHKGNFKMVLLALFGAVMGQGVIWYTGQFYAQSFLENTVKLEFMQNREIMLWGIGLATPFFLVFGWLSDKVGRKWIMLTGMLLGVIFYRPIFSEFLKDTNANKWMIDKNILVNYGNKRTMKSDTTDDRKKIIILIEDQKKWYYNGTFFTEKKTGKFEVPNWPTEEISGLAGSPRRYYSTDDAESTYSDFILSPHLKWKFIFLVWIMIIFVTMVYGPIAAFLVELFPTKIRYTSMSLPYHIGNGVFGGLVPFIGLLLTTSFADPLAGLWYPIGVAALCFIIGALYLSNKIDPNVND
jgi:MFS family permease